MSGTPSSWVRCYQFERFSWRGGRWVGFWLTAASTCLELSPDPQLLVAGGGGQAPFLTAGVLRARALRESSQPYWWWVGGGPTRHVLGLAGVWWPAK